MKHVSVTYLFSFNSTFILKTNSSWLIAILASIGYTQTLYCHLVNQIFYQ